MCFERALICKHRKSLAKLLTEMFNLVLALNIEREGTAKASNNAIMLMTTSISIRVKPGLFMLKKAAKLLNLNN